MSKIADGGQAFPFPPSGHGTGYLGMSLRDYFAGQALAGILASLPKNIGFAGQAAKDDLAGDSYEIADAMLAHKLGVKP